MSYYLQVDTDAVELFAQVAGIAKSAQGDICLGFIRLWKHCWLEKTEHVSRVRLGGFFPGCDLELLLQAAVECEFLRVDGAAIMVRGAKKRLVIRDAQSESGKQHSGNLKQNGSRSTKHRVDPESTRGSTSGSAPALTPIHLNTYSPKHPTTSEIDLSAQPTQVLPVLVELEQPTTSSRKKRSEGDPRFTPLKEKLVAEYESTRRTKYGFNGGRDAKAVSSLLAKGTDDEILMRWKRGLGVHPSWRSHCANIHELDTKWNLLANSKKQSNDDIFDAVTSPAVKQ